MKRRLDISLSAEEQDTASEVFANCELTIKQEELAWLRIQQEWKNTSGRFYAYNAACRIAGNIKNEMVDEAQNRAC